LEGVVQELDLEFVSEEVPAALTQSLEGLERVAQIVRAMKDFSHPGGERALTDLNRMVDSTVQVTRNEWKYVAELELDLDPEAGEVPCYEGEIKQTLLNVIVNAAHAIEERQERLGDQDQGLIKIVTKRRDGTVLISVSDTGVGMPPEVRARVFDPFFTTKPVGRGTGQGLAIAHNCVVNKHHGRFDVSSEPGVGSVFTIILPTAVQEDELAADKPVREA
jgi:signal transduction histidine kinase